MNVVPGAYSQHFIFFVTFEWAQSDRVLHGIWLWKLACDKHSSLLGKFVSYEENKVLFTTLFFFVTHEGPNKSDLSITTKCEQIQGNYCYDFSHTLLRYLSTTSVISKPASRFAYTWVESLVQMVVAVARVFSTTNRKWKCSFTVARTIWRSREL